MFDHNDGVLLLIRLAFFASEMLLISSFQNSAGLSKLILSYLSLLFSSWLRVAFGAVSQVIFVHVCFSQFVVIVTGVTTLK